MKRVSLILIVLLCCNASGYSQTVYKYGLPKGKEFDRWSVGAVGGVLRLQSDIKKKGGSKNSFNETSFNFVYGAQVGYQLTHSIGFSLNGTWGNVKQKPDSVSYLSSPFDSAAYVDFSSPFAEYSVNMQFSFGNISFVKRNSSLHFVVKTGVALCEMTPKLLYSRDSINYVPYNKPVKNSNITIPVGLGVRYKFGHFNVGIDYCYRKVFTDNLEGLEVPRSDYDGYSTLTAQVNYVIGKKKKAMEWVNPMELVYNDLGMMNERMDSLANDKDKDGVADIFDRDNTTPVGVKVYGDGTSLDTDGDGLTDINDADPYSTRGVKVDGTGKELDMDADGVPDSRDKDNKTPTGTLVNFQGLSIAGKGGDTTNIFNENVTNNNGGVGFFPSVFFDLNKADVKSIYYDRFLTVARVMKMNPNLVVMITGSADQYGNVELNNKLGMKRAEAAKAHLVTVYGIDPARLLTDSKGKNEPLARKDLKTTDYLNRRVDFIIETGNLKR